VADDDDVITRLKRTGTDLEQVQKDSASLKKRAQKGLRAIRSRVEPIREPGPKAKKKGQTGP
jgi:hypothetical protein